MRALPIIWKRTRILCRGKLFQWGGQLAKHSDLVGQGTAPLVALRRTTGVKADVSELTCVTIEKRKNWRKPWRRPSGTIQFECTSV